ncbi:hypothetical protein MIZ01_1071 [Sideroxyarcus emersonii]|uniref:Nucleotide-binding protein n=1 Tax=Sideroxyarcus emersonii TaxID=2764705 RepID=A0AAN1X9X5_9PROT|nr:nucleotide-binding protein [Sideroxyarcus emersonii]BCK87299.1 hypothetical protein MIZ01_1071 [Sideroxyarcus emersonii]
MKALLAIFMFVAVHCAWAGEAPAANPPATGTVHGEVLEVKEVENFTYLRLKTQDGETWAAIIKAPVKVGDTIAIEHAIVMTDFESKSLKKTFPSIIFGRLGGTGGAADAGMGEEPAMGGERPANALGTSYATLPAKKQDAINDEHVARAKGENAWSVAEVMTKGAKLKDKTVRVRGKVVKYNPGIMGRNWVHLRDGSGSAADGTNDILVTTADEAKPGDIVTAKGVVRVDKDFGAGYSYKVLIEEATLQ